jgi:hypothetical protein
VGLRNALRKEESSFCEQKEAKKLFLPLVQPGGDAGASASPSGNEEKFFWFFRSSSGQATSLDPIKMIGRQAAKKRTASFTYC